MKRCVLGLDAGGLDEDGVGRFGVICPPEREGAPGVAHGGWIADVFDEAMGLVSLFSGYFTVTQSLTVNFLRPVPVRLPLLMVVRQVSDDPGRVRVVGELNLASTGSTLTSAEAWYVQRDPEKHLTRFKGWIDTQE